MNSRGKIIAIVVVLLLSSCATFLIIKIWNTDSNNNVVSSAPNNKQPLQAGTPNQKSTSSASQSKKKPSSTGKITSTGTVTTEKEAEAETEIKSSAGLLAKTIIENIDKVKSDAEESGEKVKGGLSWLLGNIKNRVFNYLDFLNIFSRFGKGKLEKVTDEALKEVEDKTKDVKVAITLPENPSLQNPATGDLPPGGVTVTEITPGSAAEDFFKCFLDLEDLKAQTVKLLEEDINKGDTESAQTRVFAFYEKFKGGFNNLMSHLNPYPYVSPNDQIESEEAIGKAVQKINHTMDVVIKDELESKAEKVTELVREAKVEGEAVDEVKRIVESSPILNATA